LYLHNSGMLEAAVNGRNMSEEDIIIVGDSVADYYCARAIDATFLAPLTGLTGVDIKDTFTELEVSEDCMLKDVLDVRVAVTGLNELTKFQLNFALSWIFASCLQHSKSG